MYTRFMGPQRRVRNLVRVNRLCFAWKKKNLQGFEHVFNGRKIFVVFYIVWDRWVGLRALAWHTETSLPYQAYQTYEQCHWKGGSDSFNRLAFRRYQFLDFKVTYFEGVFFFYLKLLKCSHTFREVQQSVIPKF